MSHNTPKTPELDFEVMKYLSLTLEELTKYRDGMIDNIQEWNEDVETLLEDVAHLKKEVLSLNAAISQKLDLYRDTANCTPVECNANSENAMMLAI